MRKRRYITTKECKEVAPSETTAFPLPVVAGLLDRIDRLNAQIVELRELAYSPDHARQVLWNEAQAFLGDPRECVIVGTKTDTTANDAA